MIRDAICKPVFFIKKNTQTLYEYILLIDFSNSFLFLFINKFSMFLFADNPTSK